MVISTGKVHGRKITYHLNEKDYSFTYTPGEEDKLLEDLRK